MWTRALQPSPLGIAGRACRWRHSRVIKKSAVKSAAFIGVIRPSLKGVGFPQKAEIKGPVRGGGVGLPLFFPGFLGRCPPIGGGRFPAVFKNINSPLFQFFVFQ